jgi:hypothetical protein
MSSIELIVENTDKSVYEISELVTAIDWEDQLNNGCSKLEFTYLNKGLVINNGATVRFKYNDASIFYGIVFKHEQNRKKECTITAYDQLRYCKAEDTIVQKGDTVASLVKKMCNYFNLTVGTLEAPAYVLDTKAQDSKTWLDIIYDGIQDTLRYGGKWYDLRDEFGSVCLRSISSLESNLILGDASLCYDYDYSKSIDDDTYNQIKIAVDNEVTGKRDLYMAKDENSIGKYGLLQYFEVQSFSSTSKTGNTSDSSTAGTASAANEAKKKALAIQMTNSLLSLYDGETESLTMDCIGDTSIRAGSSFHAKISSLDIDKRLIVKTATHTYLPNHTMKLEVQI